MATTLQLLQELHKIDLELSDIARELAARPAAVAAAEAEVAARETERTELLAQARSIQVEADRSGVELKSLEEKIGKYQMQLNIIKTQKEYDVIRSEIAGCQMQISDLETKALEGYDQAEGLSRKARALDPDIAAKKQALSTARAQVATEMSKLEQRKAGLLAQRAEAIKPIDSDDLRRYEQAQSKHPGKAMARVEDCLCLSCNMRLSPQVYNLVLLGDPVQQCRSCGRLCYSDKKLEPHQ